MNEYIPNNRERTQDSDRSKMPKHGKNTGTLYRNAILKRAKKKSILAHRKARQSGDVNEV